VKWGKEKLNFIENPIISGFSPDPSIIRVNNDYYIANSTFEWFPGVMIHHSKDLAHWKLIARPLNRISQLDMNGCPNSCGIFAPCLTYHEGLYYLVYTNAKAFQGIWADTDNYLVTSTDICGEWSEPIYLYSNGYDPSLFHEDQKKWVVSVDWDHSNNKSHYGGIILQEYSTKENKMIGPVINIFKGTELGVTEGPHLYKHKDFYYLITAEGGTGRGHSVTVARSREITGPYEVDPNYPMLTARYDPKNEIQKAGHGDIVETQNGEWYMVHLGGRPLPSVGKCVLGRETFIQKVDWTEDGWLRLEGGGNKPRIKVMAPALNECKWEESPYRDDFDSNSLDINFFTLRIPLGEDTLTLKERPGYLRLKGRESLISTHHQSLVARCQHSFCYTATTLIEFDPVSFKQMAGLVCYYSTKNFYYLRITHEENIGKCLGIITCNNGKFDYPLTSDININGYKHCFLRAVVNYDMLQFYYSLDGDNWISIGSILDASILSDEYAEECGEWYFTGAFVGLCCQDLSGQRLFADFGLFEYIPF
jgi:xylan 1,4-beta-xylosidase